MVALTGGPEGETLIRRAARIAARSAGGDLLALYVTRSDGLTGADPAALAAQRRLTEALGGSYHQVVGDDVPEALLAFARAENATQLVLGASRRGWLSALLTGPGVSLRTIRDSGDIDVHIVTHSRMGRGRGLPSVRGGLPPPRKVAGYALALALAPLLALVLANLRLHLNLTSDMLVFLIGVIAVALVGGLIPAVVAAVTGSLFLNYYFAPPFYTFTIAEANNALALVVFVIVAVVVSSIVTDAARRSKQAARAGAESDLLVTTADSILRGEQPLQAVVDRVREAFGMDAVTLLERPGSPAAGPPSAGWRAVASSGGGPIAKPEDADVAIPVTDDLCLAARGRTLPAADRRVLGAFAAYAATALEQQRLTAEAEAVRPIAEADRIRAALLAAVSHDLRTPLAAAEAAVTSLRSRDVQWSAEDHDELLATADESLDKLTRLVENLLDMSRLQAGEMSVFPKAADLGEVIASSLDDLGLPDLDGVEVIGGLRGWTDPPIIVLSGRADSTDKVEALDAGADDYVTKPFGMDELLARMRAVVRRSATEPSEPEVTLGEVTIDLAAKHVSRNGEHIRLTPTEWHLLEVLLRHPGKLLSRRQLLHEVWGPGYADATGNLRLYIAQLRRKLEPDPARPRWLLTEPGMGYRFQPDAGPAGR